MDKLIKICRIFECSLDDLVQGDVSLPKQNVPGAPTAYMPVPPAPSTSVAATEPPVGISVALQSGLSSSRPAAAPVIPGGPAVDVCGYDEHMVALARKVALGVALIILGFAAAIFVDEVMHAEGIVLAALFAFAAAGLALLIPAGIDHSAFAKEHPYIADFYTAEQKTAARSHASVAIVVGIGIILLGIAATALFEVESNVRAYGDTLMMVLVAVGVGAIVNWSMLWGRINVADYNKEWLETVELSEDELLRLDPQSRETYLRAKDSRRRRAASRRGKACAVIMILATMVALVWLFVGYVLGTSDGIGGLFWLPWVVGSLGTAIVLVVVDDDEDELPVSESDEER